jgi:hypothetical protein
MTLADDLEALGITDATILRRARELEQVNNYWRAAVFGYGKLAAASLVDSVVDPPVSGDR